MVIMFQLELPEAVDDLVEGVREGQIFQYPYVENIYAPRYEKNV